MVWARLCLDDLYPFLITQRSQYLPNIFFDLTVYCHPTAFRCKHYMILAPPCGVLQARYILFFHVKRPPGFLLLQLADRNFILPVGLFHYIISLHSPAKPGVAFALKPTKASQPRQTAGLFQACLAFSYLQKGREMLVSQKKLYYNIRIRFGSRAARQGKGRGAVSRQPGRRIKWNII